MAERQVSPASAVRNDAAAEIEERGQLRETIKRERAARRERADAMGREVVARITDTVDARTRRLNFGTAKFPSVPATPDAPGVPEPRPLTWKGPHAGTRYRKAADLEKATMEECAAGFRRTWGFDFDEGDRHVFGHLATSARETARASEMEARGIYSELRSAIERAAAFSETQGRGNRSASIALHLLWGFLPNLPDVDDLPHYEKLSAARRALVEDWQARASNLLSRQLSSRELAEVSVLLGIGPGQPYRAFYVQKDTARNHVTVAEVLRIEGKKLDKF